MDVDDVSHDVMLVLHRIIFVCGIQCIKKERTSVDTDTILLKKDRVTMSRSVM